MVVAASPARTSRAALIRRTAALSLLLLAAIVAFAFISGAVGSVDLTLAESTKIIRGHLVAGMPWMSDGSLMPLQDQAVWQFRMPRTLLAGLASVALGTLLSAGTSYLTISTDA